MSSPATSLIATGNNSGIVGGFVDGWAVSDFLTSRDAMRQLDRKIGLRRYLTYTGLDPLNKLAPDASEDDLYRAYLSSIDVSYNMLEQINVMEVRGFSPKDAALISQALLDIVQEFINQMDDQGVSDALKVSKRELTFAEQQNAAALSAMADWQVKHGNIDPAADAAMLLTLVGQLETQLSAAQINLDKIRALNNPDHPMLHPAEMQVTALQQTLAETRKRMSGSGDTEAGQLKSYEALKNTETFADANLTVARQSYQQAYTDTQRLERYLSVISRPLPENSPSSPNTAVLLLEALAVGLVLAMLGTMGINLYRDLKHG